MTMSRHIKDNLNARAFRLLKKMMDRGEIKRPDACELCGKVPGFSWVNGRKRSWIVAHHWHGYDECNLTNVWWICNSCNIRLKGDRFHNGTVNQEQARIYLGIQP